MKALAAFMKEEEIDAAAIQECSEEEDRPVVSDHFGVLAEIE